LRYPKNSDDLTPCMHNTCLANRHNRFCTARVIFPNITQSIPPACAPADPQIASAKTETITNRFT
jgi:hypothetical protein